MIDALTFEYITLLLHFFDQKYNICVKSMDLLTNIFCTLCEIVELFLTTVKIYQSYLSLLELMKQNKRITKNILLSYYK